MGNINTLDMVHNLTMEFQDEMHRPRWPYKFKIKISGCPNDCVAAIARADLTIIGTWRDSLKIDQKAVREYVKGEWISRRHRCQMSDERPGMG